MYDDLLDERGLNRSPFWGVGRVPIIFQGSKGVVNDVAVNFVVSSLAFCLFHPGHLQ